MAAKMGRYIWNTNGKRGLSDFLSHKGRTETTARIVPMLSAYMLPKTAILRTAIVKANSKKPTNGPRATEKKEWNTVES